MRRHQMSKRHSRANFSKHGSVTHKKNVANRMIMRGGIRL